MGEIGDRGQVLKSVFKEYDRHGNGELSPLDIQTLHGNLRMGGISYPQVLASMKYVCSTDCCTLDELYDLLQEMDRRYYLLQDLRWEFSMLDREQRDTITEDQARWMVQAMHGTNYSRRKWADFLRKRAIPGSRVAFSEIEVLLCNIKSSLDCILDREEEERERQEQLERERLAEEEARRERERQKRLKDDEKRRKLEEQERKEEGARRQMMEEEERRRREQQEKEDEELRRLKEMEEKNREEEERRRLEEMEKYKDAEKNLEDAERRERELEEELRRVQQKLKEEEDEKKRKQLLEEEERLKKLLQELRHRRIRYSLKVAIKDKDKYKLEYTINEFKTEKVEDKDMDLERAEKLLKELVSRDNLRRAISRREIEELEQAIDVIKRNGLEVQLSKELIEANFILTRLRKIQRIRSEILELKQSTVAEIRSYQNPPPVVHQVMTATFLILGHRERETKDWKTVQALVGKTGKEGLKRRCLQCDASKISMDVAGRAKAILDKFELDEVRDVSAGAATFYVFTVAMIEERLDIEERGGPEAVAEANASAPPPAKVQPGAGRKGQSGAGPKGASGTKPRVDPTKMVISRSKQMVTTSGTTPASRTRSKTPPARRK